MSNKAGDGDGGGGSGGAGGEVGKGPTNPKEKKCPGCGKRARRFSFIRLRKKKQRGINVNPGCWALGASGESPTSDPNSLKFSFDMLRALIENNGFYSKDCNPHLDEDILVKQNT